MGLWIVCFRYSVHPLYPTRKIGVWHLLYCPDHFLFFLHRVVHLPDLSGYSAPWDLLSHSSRNLTWNPTRTCVPPIKGFPYPQMLLNPSLYSVPFSFPCLLKDPLTCKVIRDFLHFSVSSGGTCCYFFEALDPMSTVVTFSWHPHCRTFSWSPWKGSFFGFL